MKQCPKCYGAHRPQATCPYCNHGYQVAEKAELEERAGELTEILEIQKKEKKMEVGRARNVVTLEQIAMQRGYSPRWVKKCVRLRIYRLGECNHETSLRNII